MVSTPRDPNLYAANSGARSVVVVGGLVVLGLLISSGAAAV
jgi:hypothetical protein